ncbi:MAG: hypothetical protein J7578_06570 [Chitinophagaceae bacterium]|nr:hypothetical protein [Chitinophagaceae bacterium]
MELLLLYSLILVAIVAFTLLAKFIIRKSKLQQEKKTYLQIIAASGSCFLFFLLFGLLANQIDLWNIELALLWYVLTPSSFLLMVVFLIVLGIKMTKERISKPKQPFSPNSGQ